VELPIAVPHFEVFLFLTLKFIDLEFIMLELNWLNVNFTSVKCSDLQHLIETLRKWFTVHGR
jgi:hypothetical protein